MKFFTAYDRPVVPGLICEPGLTRQVDLVGCDINVIVNRFMATGQLPNGNDSQPQYIDCSEYDFQEFHDVVADAASLFSEQPWSSNFRSVEHFLEFMDSVANGDARALALAKAYGLIKPEAGTADEPKPKAMANDAVKAPDSFTVVAGQGPDAHAST
jgi:hypothetical protein